MRIPGLPPRDRASAAVARMLGYLTRVIRTPIYVRQRQYITLKRLDVPETTVATDGTAPRTATECLVVDSLEALQAVAPEIPTGFRDSVDELKKRVAQGCVVCLARRPRADGAGQEVIGYEIAERGVFSALGRRQALPLEVVFSHYVEVLAAYRGQRIHGRLFATRDAYFRQRGGKFLVGVVVPQNRASRKALGRAGSIIVGRVQRVSLFTGLIAWWDTRVECSDHALQLLNGAGGRSAETRRQSEPVRDGASAERSLPNGVISKSC